MPPLKILIVGPRAELPEELPSVIARESRGEILPEAASSDREALTRLSEKGYQAVVCWAEREEDLAGVLRIRQSAPDVPILVLNPRVDPAFAALARRAGATRIEPLPARDLATLSQVIRGPIESGEIFRDILRQARQAHAQAGEVRIPDPRNRRPGDESRRVPAGRFRLGFAPLLVQGDAGQALRMEKAFLAGGLSALPPVLKSGEEAIAYFSAAPPFQDRPRMLPTIVLLDTDLPGIGGLEVLEWIRRQPTLDRVPVVMLGSADPPERVRRAYALGANSYLLKPPEPADLDELAAGFQEYWGRNVGVP